MRVGVILPQFRHDAAPALEAARRAEQLGLDGVFVFDHLWPLGRRGAPALHSLTLLGAVAACTSRVGLGALVARVSLLPDDVLVDSFATLGRMAGRRVIAGVGTGDRANREENLAYGVGFDGRSARLANLVRCCRGLRAAGVHTWAGGLSSEVRDIAIAEADGWNTWGLSVADLARRAADLPPELELSWGGQVLFGRDEAAAADKLRRHGSRPGLVHGTAADARRHLGALAEAGAAWAIYAALDASDDPDAFALVAEAAAGVQ